jgi:hypothetical protein
VNDCESEYCRECANGPEGTKAALDGNDGDGEKPTVELKGNEGVKVGRPAQVESRPETIRIASGWSAHREGLGRVEEQRLLDSRGQNSH